MKLTEEQWAFIKPMLPRERVRKDKRDRPWKDPRDVLEGILWILKTGARWGPKVGKTKRGKGTKIRACPSIS